MVYEAEVVFKVLVQVGGDEDEAAELIKTRLFYQSGLRESGRYRLKAYPAHVEVDDIKRATAAMSDEVPAIKTPEPEEREDPPSPGERGPIKLGRPTASLDLF